MRQTTSTSQQAELLNYRYLLVSMDIEYSCNPYRSKFSLERVKNKDGKQVKGFGGFRGLSLIVEEKILAPITKHLQKPTDASREFPKLSLRT